MDNPRIELLQSMAIFGGVRAETIDHLLSFCPTLAVAANYYFFKEGEDGDSMFVLESGEVSVLKSWQGEERVLQSMKAGDCFGEMAVMDMGARSASVRATSECTAIQISAGNLRKIYAHDLKQFTLIQMNMGREVCRRLRDADQRLFSVDMGSPDT